MWIGQAQIEKRMYAEAIGEIQKGLGMSGDNTRVLGTLGYAYAVAGQRAKAQQLLAELQARSKRSYVSPYFLAVIDAGLGDKALALDSLEKAVQERQPYLVLLDVEPVFSNLRPSHVFWRCCSGLVCVEGRASSRRVDSEIPDGRAQLSALI